MLRLLACFVIAALWLVPSRISRGELVPDRIIVESRCFSAREFFRGIRCRIDRDRCSLRKACPAEFGWRGQLATFVFRLSPDDIHPLGYILEFHVPFEGYRTEEDASIRVRAGRRRLATIAPVYAISRTGAHRIFIPGSVFKAGRNKIRFFGKNIFPIGYGTNPPNFQINSIALFGVSDISIITTTTTVTTSTVPTTTTFPSSSMWSFRENGTILEIFYDLDGAAPQYAALHRESCYFRINYGPGSGWGTSVILCPSFWSGGRYYQGTAVDAAIQSDGSDLLVTLHGMIGGLAFEINALLMPPVPNEFSAAVAGTVFNTVVLDERPSEAFKPTMLSSMFVSPLYWDAQSAYVDSLTYPIPEEQWIINPPARGNVFGLLGGTSLWKTNAPTVEVFFPENVPITGWVTRSLDPNNDNIGLWPASDEIMPLWSYLVTARLHEDAATTTTSTTRTTTSSSTSSTLPTTSSSTSTHTTTTSSSSTTTSYAPTTTLIVTTSTSTTTSSTSSTVVITTTTTTIPPPPAQILLPGETSGCGGVIIARSNAHGLYTCYLLAGQTFTARFSLTVGARYALRVRYSNDNLNFKPTETVRIFLDGGEAASFVAEDTGDGGYGWNVFITTGSLAVLDLSSGSHALSVAQSGGDGYGIEIDVLILDLVS